MKKIMKKVLSLALVVALAIAPMTVMAGSGTTSDPATLVVDGTANECTVGESESYWYTFQSETAGTLSFEPIGDDVWLEFFKGAIGFGGYLYGADFPCGAEVPFTFDVDANTQYFIQAKTSSMGAGTVSFKVTFEEGTSSVDTIENAVNVTGQSSISVPANSTKYFYVTGYYTYGNEYTVSVDGGMAAGMGNGITVSSYFYSPMQGGFVQTGSETSQAQASVVAIGNAANGGSVYFSVTNPSLYDYTSVGFSVGEATASGGLGSYEEPDTLVAGDNQYVTLDGNEYWYTYTAEEAGTLTITINNNLSSDGWSYQVDGMSVYSTAWDEYDRNVCEIQLQADEEALFGMWVPKYLADYDAYEAYEAGAGTIYYSVSFTAGLVNDDDDDDDSDLDDDNDNSGSVLTGEEINENYFYSYQELTEGTNDIMPMFGYPTTLYAFVPTESGEYLVTIDDSTALLGYYGSNEYFPYDWTENKTTELTLNVGEVGEGEAYAPMLIGVTDSFLATVTITRVGEAEEVGGIENIIYENVHTPVEFTFAGNADTLLDSYVEVSDGKESQAVLGEDGYYHLDSADGPVLFANLSDEVMNLVSAQSYGQLTAVNYEDGVAVSKVVFYDAFEEYVACADVESIEGATLYPLTEDLMIIFKSVGEDKGWYLENSILQAQLKAESLDADAWMFACYYDEAITSLAPATEGTNSSTSNDTVTTGDNASIVVWVIAMVVAAGAAFVVAESKRRAR